MTCDKKITNQLKIFSIIKIKKYSTKDNLTCVCTNKISYDRYSNHKKKK